MPIDRAGLGTQVTELFRAQITEGAWPVGSKIPTEPELVEWSGAGRNTVREAVGSLVQAGILRREQGRGTFVVSTSELRSSVTRQAAVTSRRDSLELRLALDAASARIAATRRTPADNDHLRRLLDDRTAAWTSDDLHERVRADSALHRAVVAATHNPLLQDVYEGLLGVFEEVQLHDVAGATDDLAQLHADLVAAIVAADPDRAAATMSALLQPMINQESP
ncbi:GntR family transcriptional regulator [Paractinoplanes abujensis]|uniref:DNA-binding FadR family transcriptional regulator n=1 Tax=Paractinoplanes abujensis TaxID=882441 RepID=A0A7W7G073_9ACTN|nr:FCD domain-containing protein [Actinoplanes abujensis]MBB4692828.1 DNA-binding FadR family transcriptional regulator [Actinoplanes abujensis]GID22673.1 GntR family transcriptional regulator [Actinoplanes abujensis]